MEIEKKIVGQPELRLLLDAALNNGKLSHALMLIGPAGSGKRSWGRQLARAILCPQRSGAEPCRQCRSCRSFASGSHPGYFQLKPAKRRLKTEQIREVKEHFYLAGGAKVCLIEQAETLTAEACAALLKILEEPPAGLTFILLVEQPRQLPDTILSRCQCYYLRPLAAEELTGLLVGEKEITYEKASLLARISAGLPGYAYMLAEDDALDEKIEEASNIAYKLAVGQDSVSQLFNWAEQLAQRDDLALLLELMAMIYRDGLMQNLCRSGDRPGQFDPPRGWLESIMPGRLEEAVLELNRALGELNATNVNRRLLLEKTFIVLQRRLN